MAPTEPVTSMRFAQRFMAALAVGAILCFASEMLFWSAPLAGTTLADIALTWAFYALAAWAGLAAAAWAGLRNWPGLLLGGSVFGWLVEGVLVDTVYSALPWTIPFTAMSWHALISVLGVFVLVRLSASWRPTRQIALLVAMGAGFGLWAQYWPLERGAMPPDPLVWAYLVGLGMAVPIGNHLLDALPRHYPHHRAEALILVAVFALIWGGRMILSGNPAYLILPGLIGVTLWLMRRGGHRQGGVTLPARPAYPARHWLFLITPALTALIATTGWRGLGGVESNGPLAILMSGAALWLYGRAVIRVFLGTKGDHTGAV